MVCELIFFCNFVVLCVPWGALCVPFGYKSIVKGRITSYHRASPHVPFVTGDQCALEKLEQSSRMSFIFGITPKWTLKTQVGRNLVLIGTTLAPHGGHSGSPVTPKGHLGGVVLCRPNGRVHTIPQAKI